MTPFELVLLVLGAVLALSAVPVVHRMIVGPTILDRAVASDMFIVLTVFALALLTAWTRSPWALAPMLMLTGLAFIGTVAVARFVVREETPAQRRSRTWTGPVPSISARRAADATPSRRRDDRQGRAR